MYKNIEMLDKKKFKSLKFDSVEPFEVGKTMSVLPLGFHEILKMVHYCPVVIMGDDENLEFVAFCGIPPEATIFNDKTIYSPIFIRTYPFLNVIAKDNKGILKSVIGIDKSESTGAKKENSIFKSNGDLEKLTSEKIQLVQELNRQRDISKKLVAELKANDLLVKKDFKVILDGKEKVILEKFYSVNRSKLIELPDELLALWGKKGWLTIIDMHLISINNFSKLFRV